MRTYNIDVLGIKPPEAIITLNTDTLKLKKKKIQEYSVNQKTNARNHPKSGVITLAYLARVALEFNWLDNRSMNPNMDLLNRIKSIEAANHWRYVYHQIPKTKTSSPDDINLSKLSKSTETNSIQFYDWYNHLILNMDNYTSVDGVNSGGYILIYSDSPVNYRTIDWGLSLGEQFKSIVILDGGYYKDDKYRFFTAFRKALADSGLYWIEKDCVIMHVCLGIKKLNNYYYGIDNEEE